MLGGTFSPPHIGHLKMAKATLDALKLDEIIFIPCGDPPHKDGREVWDSDLRLEMTRLLIKDEEKMSVSDIEIINSGKSYTAKTLTILKNANPDTAYYFIVGADSLCYMDEWMTPDLIFKNAEIVVLGREGFTNQALEDYMTFLEDKYGAIIHKVFMEKVDISSSMLREKLSLGEDVSKYTGRAIYSLILEKMNENRENT